MASTMANITVIIMARNNKKSSILGVVVAILIVVVVVLVIALAIGIYKNKTTEDTKASDEALVDNTVNDATTAETQTLMHASEYQVLPDEKGIPVAQIDVDVESLKNINADVCGWIYIPDTGVNCPVVCNSDNPDYYLTNDIDKINGTFIQNFNSSNFTDRMTVVYGKNQNGKSQFEGILKYRDKAFFDNHKYAYVLSDNRILTYKVFAARKAYAEHLMLGYDWSVDQIFIDYLTYILKSSDGFELDDVETAIDIDPSANIDSSIDISVDDRVLTLSERIPGEDNYRYLVQGVLINESIKEAP